MLRFVLVSESADATRDGREPCAACTGEKSSSVIVHDVL
jgi:hypothetical protein